ncbi:MAG: hypothetical protein ACFE9R_17670 [Candidatus Hermodarchaeota archaeon]
MVITDIDYSNRFLEVLQYLQSTYEKFPKFLIEIIAENFGIPSSEVKELIYMFRKKGMLKILKDEGYYFQLQQNQENL